MNTLKSTSRWQGRAGDRTSEGSLSANLRAYAQELYQAEPQGESAQHDEAHPDHCGMVNTEVVQRKIVVLPGEIYLPKLSNDSGVTEPAKVRVNRVEDRYIAPCNICIHAIHGVISRGRELRIHSEERSEGSVTGDAREL